MKILVVEDHPTHLKLASILLHAGGHQVRSAEAAELAFAAIEKDRPELILLDIGLPGMNGLELARRLKADPATQGILVVAITSYPEQYSQPDALAAGCDAFIAKPVNSRTLAAQLEAVVKAK